MVAALGTHGHDAVHWSAVGNPDATDAEIMGYAWANDRVVITHDLDFGTILAASGAERPSVVIIRSENLPFDAVGSAVIAALDQFSRELSAGALVSVQPERSRARLLPLR